jgi:hypothetical protein
MKAMTTLFGRDALDHVRRHGGILHHVDRKDPITPKEAQRVIQDNGCLVSTIAEVEYQPYTTSNIDHIQAHAIENLGTPCPMESPVVVLRLVATIRDQDGDAEAVRAFLRENLDKATRERDTNQTVLLEDPTDPDLRERCTEADAFKRGYETAMNHALYVLQNRKAAR